MRILMLNNEFPPLGGGTGTVNQALLQQFSSSDIHIDLITSSRNKSEYSQIQFSDRIRIFYVPVDNKNIHHSTSIELIRYSFRSLFVLRKLLKSFPRYDLCFCFSTLPAGVIGALVKLFTSIPLLVSLQGPDIPGFEVRYRNLYPFIKPLIRLVWSVSDVVLVLSAKHKELASQTKKLEFHLLPNGIDADKFHATNRSVPSESQPLRLVSVARLVARKRIDLIISAMALMKGSISPAPILTIIGTGDEETSLKELTSKLGLEDNVIFKGFVEPSAMPDMYRVNDIFLMTSEHEGMSMAMLEAMASGLAIVSVDVGGVQELVANSQCGIVVNNYKPADFCDVIKKLNTDRSLVASMSERARNHALNFSWKEIANNYLSLFKRFVSE